VPSERLAIAHVTPYPWGGGRQDVTTYVERCSAELARRGHRVVIVAPSRSHDAVRETRQALRAALVDPEVLLPAPGEPPRMLTLEGDAGRAAPWVFRHLRPAEEYVGAVAIEGGEWEMRTWSFTA